MKSASTNWRICIGTLKKPRERKKRKNNSKGLTGSRRESIIMEMKKEKTMLEFVKVMDNSESRKQAVFTLPPEDGTPAQFFLYSYVNNDMAHETMVFRCDENGESDMTDLVAERGYVSSDVIMQRLVDHLVLNGDLLCEQEA